MSEPDEPVNDAEMDRLFRELSNAAGARRDAIVKELWARSVPIVDRFVNWALRKDRREGGLLSPHKDELERECLLVVGRRRLIERYDLSTRYKFSTFAWKYFNEPRKKILEREARRPVPLPPVGPAVPPPSPDSISANGFTTELIRIIGQLIGPSSAVDRYEIMNSFIRGGPLDDDTGLPGLAAKISGPTGENMALRRWALTNILLGPPTERSG